MARRPQQYQVTRGGRDVFVGDAAGLVVAAGQGRIRENDLVFDPSTDTWVFARSHELFKAYDLEAQVAKFKEPLVDGGVDDGAEQQLRRRRVFLATAGMSLLLVLTGVVGWFAISGGDLGLLTYLAEPPPTPTVIKAPRVVKASPETSLLPAAEDLVFNPEAGGREIISSDVFVEPDDAHRRAYGNHSMKIATRILEKPTGATVGNERLRDLLGAAARAEFAKLNMQKLGDKEAIEESKALIERINQTFESVCRTDHSKRYCELKLKYPSWSDPILAQIEAEKVVVGMRSDHVFAAWGRPTRLRREGQSQRYCYGQFCWRSLRMINRVVIEVNE